MLLYIHEKRICNGHAIHVHLRSLPSTGGNAQISSSKPAV